MQNNTLSRRGFLALMASLSAVVLAAAVSVPAFATEVVGTLEIDNPAITVTEGDQVDLEVAAGVGHTILPEDTAWHYDFVSADDTKATVNKHSGVLTAVDAGTVQITVYLMEGTAPQGNNGKPCTGRAIYDQETITVTVTEAAASDYGFQGDGGNAVKLTDATVTNVSGDATAGYVNTLGDYSANLVNGYYVFTFEMTSGFRNFNSVDGFTDENGDYIMLQSGSTTYDAADGLDKVFVSAVDNDTKTFEVSVDATLADAGASLVLGSDLHGNNANNTIGCPLTFVL